jgi:WD40 repeat protein
MSIASSNGDVLTCSEDNTICRWNRFTGELIRTYSGHSEAVNCIQFNMDINVMISASDDNRIFLWNVETGEKIGEMNGHSDSVSSLAFVNATTIVSGSADETVKIWDIPTRKEIKTMSSHTDVVISIPLRLARSYGIATGKNRLLALVYTFSVFLIIPAIILGISQGSEVAMYVIVALILFFTFISLLFNRFRTWRPDIVATWMWLPESVRIWRFKIDLRPVLDENVATNTTKTSIDNTSNSTAENNA